MSSAENNFQQFQIPANDVVEVPVPDNLQWHEAQTYNEKLGLEEASADVERRQRETDFNESQAETTAVYREAVAAIEDTANIVIDLRARFCSDDGTVNGVKAA